MSKRTLTGIWVMNLMLMAVGIAQARPQPPIAVVPEPGVTAFLVAGGVTGGLFMLRSCFRRR